MKIKLVAVGKLKKPYVREGAKDYISRIKHYIPFEVVEVKETDISKLLTGEVLNVLLDMRGDMFTSEKFADFINKRIIRYDRDITFFVGGAEGFSDEERNSADMLVSLSKMTLPHEIARLVLLEQIYRAFTIIRNEKYHK